MWDLKYPRNPVLLVDAVAESLILIQSHGKRSPGRVLALNEPLWALIVLITVEPRPRAAISKTPMGPFHTMVLLLRSEWSATQAKPLEKREDWGMGGRGGHGGKVCAEDWADCA